MMPWEHFSETILMDSARWNVALFFPNKLIINYGMAIIILGDLEYCRHSFAGLERRKSAQIEKARRKTSDETRDKDWSELRSLEKKRNYLVNSLFNAWQTITMGYNRWLIVQP